MITCAPIFVSVLNLAYDRKASDKISLAGALLPFIPVSFRNISSKFQCVFLKFFQNENLESFGTCFTIVEAPSKAKFFARKRPFDKCS